MNTDDDSLNTRLKDLGSFLSLSLPFAQFSFEIFGQIKTIFINQSIIFFTTLTTFFLSIFIIFITKHFRYFRRYLSTKDEKKYLDYIAKIDPRKFSPEEIAKVERVPKPTEIDLKGIALIGVLIFFVTSSAFTWLGLNFTSADLQSKAIPFWQSVLYILTFVNATFIITVFSMEARDRKKWLENKQTRIQRAINLAKENNAFKEYQPINFYYANENFGVFPNQFIVEVFLGQDKEYRIVTDLEAEILYAVYPIEQNKKK